MIEISPKLNREKVLKELSFDEEGRWAAPILNRLKVVDSAVLPRNVILKDDTFRESTNMPGVAPTNEQKLKLAKKMEAVGVKEIVGGHAGIDEQCEFMRMVKDSCPKLMVHGFIDWGNWERCIDKAVAAGVDAIWIPGVLNPSSTFVPGKLGSRYGYWSQDFDLSLVLETAKAAIQKAKDKGKLVTVARAPLVPEIFEKTLDTYIKAGADRITIFDDKGVYTPQAMAYMVKMHRDIVGPDIKLEVHCHDDFGLALANSLESVRAGADVVDCMLNGLGHRCGNCTLDQIVLALEFFYDVRTGVDLSQLMSLCQLASDVYGVPIPPMAPHIGASAYGYIGAHIPMILQEGWFLWEGLRAEAIGQRRNIIWGPTAFRHGTAGPVAVKIQTMGLQFNEKQFEQVIAKLRKVVERKKFATDEELEAIVHEVLG